MVRLQPATGRVWRTNPHEMQRYIAIIPPIAPAMFDHPPNVYPFYSCNMAQLVHVRSVLVSFTGYHRGRAVHA